MVDELDLLDKEVLEHESDFRIGKIPDEEATNAIRELCKSMVEKAKLAQKKATGLKSWFTI